MSTPILQQIEFSASADRMYAVLLDSVQFSLFTGGAPASIDAREGGRLASYVPGAAGEVPGNRASAVKALCFYCLGSH